MPNTPLALVDSTPKLRLLPKESSPELCDELRRYLLDSVSRSSGHFASGQGTVELTVALHYVYNTPFGPIVLGCGASGLSA
ncbi:1-deoxy-D-xylulose-5-phosphate synthase N-terminal domain-containing protein [Escherichia coli]|uniref:1-deoxy-D-xylulose-5-phosphate synthase N-terminal domain-containing protein n=1 Tax=Escherichia coli TaxID=562 RepID=UPI0039DF82A9